MDWNDVRLVLEVARTGSFAGAAAVMGVNAATVSRKVGAMEQASRIMLFKRNPFGATPTAAGEALIKEALRVDEEVANFRTTLERLQRVENAPVKVRASEGVASFLLTPLMAGEEVGPLGLSNRQIKAELPTMTLLTPHESDEADIELLWTGPRDLPQGRPTDKIRKLAEISFLPFFGAAYGSKQESVPTGFDDLSQHKLITLKNYKFFDGEDSLGQWNHLLGDCPTPLETNWTAAMGQLTVAGAGISLLPNYVTLYDRGLIPLDIGCPDMRCVMWMRADSETLRDPRVRRCFDGMSKIFGGFDWSAGLH